MPENKKPAVSTGGLNGNSRLTWGGNGQIIAGSGGEVNEYDAPPYRHLAAMAHLCATARQMLEELRDNPVLYRKIARAVRIADEGFDKADEQFTLYTHEEARQCKRQ